MRALPAWMIFLALAAMGRCAAAAPPVQAPADPDPMIVELLIGEDDVLWQRAKGTSTTMVVGKGFSLFLDDARGMWNEDSSKVQVAADAERVSVRVGERYLDWLDGDYQIDEILLVQAPGAQLIMRRGWVEIEGRKLTLIPGGSMRLGDAPQGWAISAVILVIIALLFWSGGRMRRQLQEERPRPRRHRPGTST